MRNRIVSNANLAPLNMSDVSIKNVVRWSKLYSEWKRSFSYKQFEEAKVSQLNNLYHLANSRQTSYLSNSQSEHLRQHSLNIILLGLLGIH